MGATKVCLTIASVFVISNTVHAATERDYDNVTTYATLMGRAVACGEDISRPSKKVGAWMDRTFYGKDKSTQTVIFTTAIQYAAEQQKSGKSPDKCSAVIRTFKTISWP